MKFLKISVYALLGLLVIVLVGGGIFMATFDANQYRLLISEQVQKQTGRELQLADIKPSIFPWLGIKLQQLELSNAKGFSDDRMLAIEQLDVRVELLPLFKKQLHIDTVRVHGLNVNLEKNTQGRTNWQDILDKQASSQKEQPVTTGREVASQSTERQSEETAPTESILAALAVNGVEIEEAEINWRDQLNQQNVALKHVQLSTGAIKMGQALPLNFSARVESSQPAAILNIETETEISYDLERQQYALNDLMLNVGAAVKDMGINNAQVNVQSHITADLAKQMYELKKTAINIKAKGDAIPGGDINAKINIQANANLALDSATVSSLSIETLGLNMLMPLTVSQLSTAPAIKGEYQLKEFNPEKLTKQLAVNLPAMRSDQALKTAFVSFNVDATTDSVALKKLNIQFDESALTGFVSVKNFAKPSIRYQLKMDKILLDDYLPPVDTSAASTGKTGAAAVASTPTSAPAPVDTPIELPVALIRDLDVDGDFRLLKAQGFEQQISDLYIKTRVKDGIANLSTIKANLLGGGIQSSAQLDVSKNTPRYKMTLNAKGLKADSIVNPVLQDMLGEKAVRLTGASNVNMNVNTRGQTVHQLKANSNGTLKFNMGKSTLHGVDVEYFVSKAVIDYMQKKKYKVPDALKRDYKPKATTALKLVRASATIRNGVLDNRDLLLDSSRVKVTGAGQVDIPREKLKYRVVADVKPTQLKTSFEKLLDVPVPVNVKGTFKQPVIDIDEKAWLKGMGKVVKKEAKKKAKKAVKKEADKQKKKAEEKAKKKLKKLEDKYKDKLKGLF